MRHGALQSVRLDRDASETDGDRCVLILMLSRHRAWRTFEASTGGGRFRTPGTDPRGACATPGSFAQTFDSQKDATPSKSV